MRRKIVAGNWKMHGTQASNRQLLKDVVSGVQSMPQGRVEVAVCVPFPYLAQAQSELAGSAVAWGAQTLSEHVQGAYTGEIAAAMLVDFACRYVLVGHSERRALYGEGDALVAAKFMAALDAGLTPVLCVGETLAEREAGGDGSSGYTSDRCGHCAVGRGRVAPGGGGL
jgi:triosephosphate isomerase